MKIEGLHSTKGFVEMIRGAKDGKPRLISHIKDCEFSTPYTRRGIHYKVLHFTEHGTFETWVRVDRIESVKF